MKRHASQLAVACATLIGMAGVAGAAPADDAIKACRAAIQAETGEDTYATLTKLKSRGVGYEIWFNVKDEAQPMKSWCYLKRGEVQQLVTDRGQWKGSNPQRPEGVDLG